MKPIIIITNNPTVIKAYDTEEMLVKETMQQVLFETRNLIHLGHKLISHPMPGSVKPNETPYRSVMVSKIAEDHLDFQSLTMVEAALRKFDQFQNDRPTPQWSERILNDFQVVDYHLLTSGYQSILA
jgi:hypothetical protein